MNVSIVHLPVQYIRSVDCGANYCPMDGTVNNRLTLYFFSSLNCQHPNGKTLPPQSLTIKSKKSLKFKPLRLNSSCLSNKQSPIYISKMYWSIYIVFSNTVFSILVFNSLIHLPIRVKTLYQSKDLQKFSALLDIEQNIEIFRLLSVKKFIGKKNNSNQNLWKGKNPKKKSLRWYVSENLSLLQIYKNGKSQLRNKNMIDSLFTILYRSNQFC